MSKLNNEMKNLERLEKERREMLSKMDMMSSEQQSKKSSMDMSKNVGDLNMKLKMEIGALRGENEGLAKKHDEVIKEIKTLEDQIQVKILFKTISVKSGEGNIFKGNRRTFTRTLVASMNNRQLILITRPCVE